MYMWYVKKKNNRITNRILKVVIFEGRGTLEGFKVNGNISFNFLSNQVTKI